MTLTIVRQSLADIATELEDAKRDAADAAAHARMKRDQLAQVKHKMRTRMAADGVSSFTDSRTGTRYWIATVRDHEITDPDLVLVALSQRGRLKDCTRLDARAVKKEARSEALEGTTPTVTRALRSRRKKGS
jgi:hypothetical protein